MKKVLEISLKNWQKYGFSNSNYKHYNIRLKHGNTEIKILNIYYSKKKKNLLLEFYVKPTFLNRNVYGTNYVQRDVEYIDNTGRVKSSKYRKYYNVRLLYEDTRKLEYELEKTKFITKYSDMRKKRRQIVKEFLADHPFLKIWASDLSFLFQGSWHLLDKLNSSIYKFPKNLKDKGIWLKRHGNFGLHLTKHLIGVFELVLKSVNEIDKILEKNYKL